MNSPNSPENMKSLAQDRDQAPLPAVIGPLLIGDLGWNQQEALETRARLAALEEDWDSPGMEDYDRL